LDIIFLCFDLIECAECSSGVCEGVKCKEASGFWNLVWHHFGDKGWWEAKGVWSQDFREAMVELQGGAGIQAH